ncbi:rRNA pseudouridine synthase [Flavobacteriales bacterium]|jgi:23S rRNA pseudouridine2605 synthase|nr:rRNA pseudouridine synthase [Flavobacteriales bacterium]
MRQGNKGNGKSDSFQGGGKNFSGNKKRPSKNRLSVKKGPAKPSEGVRLNKYIANAGIASRRDADGLITAGAVEINGKVVTELGTKVMPGDIVHYGGERISPEKNVYILLNKPKDFIATSDDPFNRRTVLNLVANACKERVFPVGRLDRSTLGVLLLTNDGLMTKKLTSPKNQVKQIYHVFLDKNLTNADLVKLEEGVFIEGSPVMLDTISFVKGSKKEIGIEIHSGRNKIVRKIFEELGYSVTKLDRVEFAGLTKKGLLRGKWRFLNEQEVQFLQMLS